MSDFPTLTLRGPQSDDWIELFTLLNHEAIIQNSLETPYQAEDVFREQWSGALSDRHVVIAEIEQASGRKQLVGVAQLKVLTRRRRHLGKLTLALLPDYHTTGVADALLEAMIDLADNWLGLRRMETIIFTADDTAHTLYEQHGFQHEATLQQYAFRAGEYSAADLLARLPVASPEVVSEDDNPNLAERTEAALDNSPLAIMIRAIEPEDWEDVVALRESGRNVIYNTMQVPYMPHRMTRDFLENLTDDHPVIVAVVDDQVVGQLGLHLGTGRQAHVAHLGMWVHAAFQGRGVGSALVEAAIDLAENWLNISRIELGVFTDNAAGQALYRKFGFELEGTTRQYTFRDGHFVNAYLMARLRTEDE